MAGNMEFLSENLINTTTMLSVGSGTATAQYMIDKNVGTKYLTDAVPASTPANIIISFAATTPVSHLVLRNINASEISMYHGATTTNSLVSVTTNSGTSFYAEFSLTSVMTLTVVINDPFTGTDKYIGEIGVHTRTLEFERNPSAKDYKPSIDRQQIQHEMPDGGLVLFNIANKFQAKISFDFITSTFYDDLLAVYEDASPLFFVPFPTTTAWDGRGYEVVWPGQFDFKHSTNDKVQGYSGSIVLRETPGA